MATASEITGPVPTSTERAATAKRAESRAHILTTAVAAVDELGIAGASASEIARRAGLSWGVIQYHFGDRLGLLLATFDLTIDRYVERLDTWSFDGTISERCGALVDGLWSQMATSHYRTSLEIQLHLHRHPAASVGHHSGARRAADASRDLWQRTFPDIDRVRVGRVQEMVMPSLRRFAVSRALGADDSSTAGGRVLLADAAATALTAPERS